MGIEMVGREDRSAGPQVFCDVCRRLIDDLRDGNAEWRRDDEGQPMAGTLSFRHKECPVRDSGAGWVDLPAFIIQIAVNHDLDWAAAWRSAVAAHDLPSSPLTDPRPPWR